jgi:hypothetical protein
VVPCWQLLLISDCEFALLDWDALLKTFIAEIVDETPRERLITMFVT